MRKEIKVLKDHRQTRAQQAQLVFIRNLELTVFVAHQTNILTTDYNRPSAWFLKKVNAAQEGTFTGT